MVKYVCTSCDYMGSRKRLLRGSTAMEVALWALLLVPGPFYSIWRRTGRRFVCPICNAEAMVPMGSPIAKRKLSMLDDDLSDESIAKIPDRWAKDREAYLAREAAQKVRVRLTGRVQNAPAYEESIPSRKKKDAEDEGNKGW